MNITSTSDIDLAFIEEKYHGFDPLKQEILQIMALLFVPLSRTEIATFINKRGFASQTGRAIPITAIRDIIDSLVKDFGYLDEINHVILIREFSDYIIINYCAANPNIQSYRQAISANYSRHDYWYAGETYLKSFRDFRIAFFLKEYSEARKIAAEYDRHAHYHNRKPPESLYQDIFEYHICREYLDQIPDQYRLNIVFESLHLHIEKLSPLNEFIDYFEHRIRKNSEIEDIIMLANCYLFQGEFDKINHLKHSLKLNNLGTIDALAELFQGNLKQANEIFLSEIPGTLKRQSKLKRINFRIDCLYYCLMMSAAHEYEHFLVQTIINNSLAVSRYNKVYTLFEAFAAFSRGHTAEYQNKMQEAFNARFYQLPMSAFEYPAAVILCWQMDKQSIKSLKNPLLVTCQTALKHRYVPLAVHCFQALNLIHANEELPLDDQQTLQTLNQKYLDLTTLFAHREEWEKSLKALRSIAQRIKLSQQTAEDPERLIWLVGLSNSELFFIPKEQKRGSNRQWSKGRAVSLKRIMNCEVPCMSDLDRKISTCIEQKKHSTYGYYYEIDYQLDVHRALPFFLKHPYLFLEEAPDVPVEFSQGDIQLIVKKNKSNFEICLSEEIDKLGFQVIQETPSHFKIVEVNDLCLSIAKLTGKNRPLQFPLQAENELKDLLKDLSSSLVIHSDIAGNQETALKEVAADPALHAHLLPLKNGLRINFYVRPFSDQGPYFKPGQGGNIIISEFNGVHTQAVRNKKMEIALAAELFARCSFFNNLGSFTESFQFESLEESLDALMNLMEVKDQLTIEWPEGERFKITNKIDHQQIHFSIGKVKDWFEINGTLNIGENQILEMAELLKITEKTKFIPLKDNEFIALTQELADKINEIRQYAFVSKDKVKIHPLNSLAADRIFQDFSHILYDNSWKKQLKKAEAALDFQPKIPTTLQAELRPYQVEGFEWLSRLAAWGAGACLADDMGLGKTVQALAAILNLAVKGPCLVIAPSSVCFNWITEANRFVPTLNTILFNSGNRQKILDHLQPFDLVICSYNLLYIESEKLAQIKWAAVILDEAQSIKNFKARRTQAAFDLQGDFKLITTGTPIENNLNELWTLFNFINPGLLGSQNEFIRRFANPIEKDQNILAKNSLKQLIKPFILRRKKSQVLQELPPKTEIRKTIEFSSDEMTFYEALRRESLNKIELLKGNKQGAIHLQILAELTRLRMACCHPALINKNIEIASSKLKVFGEIVAELIENCHKALVFSQFVSHLHILQNYCQRNHIHYQYLDGSTPMKERQRRVNAFQAGEGDIFLISLKAGGTGLNLTAADYVIHMDPWWNPAVEDQASDRAHRIGQNRPVTVYSLVAKDTVEEKIIALHHTKRELADSLLEGTDISARISAEELLKLII